MIPAHMLTIAAVVCLASACTNRGTVADSPLPRGAPVEATTALPADASTATVRLNASSRHGEWVMVRTGSADSVKAWVVYPERSTKAPVVIVVHEIFGLSPWIRSVADQLAADGFIAIAPDFVTTKNLPEGTDSASTQAIVAAVRTLDPAQVQRQIDAVAQYGMSLPSALRKYGVVGFCWGGAVSFAHAVHTPNLGASVVYYGTSPRPELLGSVRAPVLGLYGSNDARVNATIPAADSAMRAMGKTYVQHIYPGAGHGFLRQQPGMEGANMAATRAAWPATIAWFRNYLGA
ncbi:MAG TPA: dienelactone hydrolase family protein [Gemmatimonadaceae bacterium]|nr:dienelactone hydrolase family protein [Gemmatimonadaceae bacterium]